MWKYQILNNKFSPMSNDQKVEVEKDYASQETER